MKKMKFLAITMIAMLMALVMNVQPTYASSADLYDDDMYNTQGGTTITLLENSEYQVSIDVLSGAPFNNNFSQDLGQGEFSLELFGGAFNQNFEGDALYWENTFSGGTWTFETTIEQDFDVWMSSDGGSSNLTAFADNYDIQIIWLGNTEPVDNIAPEYTYSNAEIDTPYYDLATVSEVQSQLQAVDDVDGDVSSSITVYEDEYTSITPKVVGDEYFIMFSVEDTAGNAAYLRVDINVIDDLKPELENGQETYSDGDTLEFEWYDDNFSSGMMDFMMFFQNSTLVDDYYGDADFNQYGTLSDAALALGWSENGTGGDYAIFNPETPGVYDLPSIYTDPSGNSMTLNIEVTVLENNAPVINGPTELTREAVGFNVNDILSSYSATDNEDGSLSVSIDSHDVYENVIGSYSVTVSATDSFGVETTKTVSVSLVDTTDPVFKVDGIASSTYTHTVYMSDTTTLQSLIDTITVVDGYYGDITLNMVVPAYPDFDIPGTSTLTLTATDGSGNSSALNIEVTIDDDISPVINGAVKIVKGINETLTLSDILAELNVTDNVDTSISLVVELDNYTGNSGNIGSYLVKYSATDSSGNKTIHDVRVWVVDNEAPAWILNDYFVNLGINNPMDRNQLVSLLQSAGMIGSDISYTVSFVEDEYSGNEEIPGVYDVRMHITFNDGSEDNIAVQLNVADDSSTDDVIGVDPVESLSPFQKAIRWVKNAFTNSINWVKGAWNWSADKVDWVLDLFRKPEDLVPDGEVTTDLSITTEVTTAIELPFTPSTTLPVFEL